MEEEKNKEKQSKSKKKDDIDFMLHTTKKLTALVVDDEQIILDLMAKLLERYFAKVYKASDGVEGLEVFLNNKIDIVVTDNNMPRKTGIEMIREIRNTDANLPIVLVTALVETNSLIEALNLNVSRFIQKPVRLQDLTEAIKKCASEIIAKEIEFNFLKEKETKHKIEEEMAFKKQISLVKNDFKNTYIENNKNNEAMFFKVFYNPMEYISGDAYSIRKIDDDNVLICLMDSMGKGFSASITSILSCSYIDDIFLKYKDSFKLEDFIFDYQEIIKRKILDEEILSILFAHLNIKEKTFKYASYSMPPVLFLNDEQILKVKSNNIPINKHYITCKIDTISFRESSKILMYSDGVNEAIIGDSMYGDFIEEDFKNYSCSKYIHDKLTLQDGLQSDDLTMIHISILKPQADTKIASIEIPTDLGSVKNAICQIEELLEKESGSVQFAQEYIVAISEILFNAYEHGSLKIDRTEKQKLLELGVFEEKLQELEKINFDKKIIVEIFRKDSIQKCFIIIIQDEGDGFDVDYIEHIKDLENQFCGRGILMTKRLVNAIFYNQKGNRAMLVKTCENECELTIQTNSSKL